MSTKQFTHTPEAIESSRAYDGFTGWDIDDYANGHGWHGVGILPVSRTRDADTLTRSNWDSAFSTLKEYGSDIDTAYFAHALVGWVELGTYNTGNPELCQAVELMRESLNGYPVLDEVLWSEYEEQQNHPDNDDRCYDDDERCSIYNCGRVWAYA